MSLMKFLLDLGILLIDSIIVTLLSTKLPDRCYDYRSWLFSERKFENSGVFYQRVFRVKRWKDRLPEISDLIRSAFPKKSVKEFEKEYMEKFLLESCRSEFAHWCIICSAIIFLFFEGMEAFFCMLLISALVNLPFIIIQRYNRPRIILIMRHKGIEI